MIKLTDYNRKEDGEEIYISKDNIGDMKRQGDMTYLYTKNYEPATYRVKETPEEILAMPDIDTTENVIDWEQRRYEIAKEAMIACCSPLEVDVRIAQMARFSINLADRFIEELKKGQGND